MTSTSAPAADFSCAICLDTATEPVVTRCGHLFCWECLEHWLHSAAGAPECPVCKGRVDERMAGDIIPLYGKGRQPVKKTGSSQSTSSAPSIAAVAATAATESAATPADIAQEEFFSRPSAYSFAPGRDARRAARTSSQQQQPPEQQPPQQQHHDHHPRPSANRAPPHPRPQQRHQFQNVHINRGGMPLTMGSGIFFFGGGTGMLFSILVVAIWALYHYAPWREWLQVSARWLNRLRGNPELVNTTQAEQGTAGARQNRASTPPAAARSTSAGPSVEDPTDDASPPTIVRNLIISLFLVFISIQLVAYM